MKNIYLGLILAIGTMGNSFAQIKSTGTIDLFNGFTVKIDINNTTNLATFELTGPKDNWLSIGLDAYDMYTTGDCITYTTGSNIFDRHFNNGEISPSNDGPSPSGNLTYVSSSNPTSTTKKVTFTRLLNTQDTKDYTFDYAALSSLNIVWSIGPNITNIDQQHIEYGSTTLTFKTLGTDDFSSFLDQIKVFPNPSNGVFKITKSVDMEISKIKVFDMNAKLIKVLDLNSNDDVISVDLIGLTKGTYFLELSNLNDKAVKKIQIN